jgi:hypothetical protein
LELHDELIAPAVAARRRRVGYVHAVLDAVITASWGVIGGAVEVFWSWEQKNAAPAGVFFLRHCSSAVKGVFCEKFSWSAGTGKRLADSWTLCQFSRSEENGKLGSPEPRCAYERIQHLDAEQLVCVGQSRRAVCLPDCRRMVCPKNSDNHESFARAIWGAA